ncbi:hypothetical protein F383_17972 [Gossypium arboreum]|uniref:Uncharacterized protein n=1 Tax=Gossypium arboreum TaxID=29729 RepID=A0A0B0NTM5_GOSAR|nr:hypothetical protein F383_17972 [Gossypium arboreum]
MYVYGFSIFIHTIYVKLWLAMQQETSRKPACRSASKLNQRSSSILFILVICNLI